MFGRSTRLDRGRAHSLIWTKITTNQELGQRSEGKNQVFNVLPVALHEATNANKMDLARSAKPVVLLPQRASGDGCKSKLTCP